MLCMLCYVCEDSQSNNCVYEACRYLLSLSGKNATANKLQYLSNKKKTNGYIYIYIEFQKSIERLSFLCRITDIKIAWINLRNF